MGRIDKLIASYQAYQKQLVRDLLKRHTAEQANRNRLAKLFPPAQVQQEEGPPAPAEDTRAKQILKDIEAFDNQHAEFVRDLGVKHT